MKFHKDGTAPCPYNGEIFVFGSNLDGIHGAGAAKYAFHFHGAIRGIGSGRVGSSFAIPTKDRSITTLPLESIIPYIKDFCEYTVEHPELQFWVTRVGCGLAGYKDQQIAPRFVGCGNNCNFPEQWKQYLTSEQ